MGINNPAAIGAFLRGDMDNFVTAATPGGIEAQEAAGQATFVANSTLPKECPRTELEKMGIRFGKDFDDLFVKVTLPDGWKKRATEHSMHNDLLDDKDRKRAGIFYKAAFYDRRADLRLVHRYNVNGHWPCDEQGNAAEFGKHTHLKTVVTDCESTVLESFGIVDDRGQYTRERGQLTDQHDKAARAWLDEKFPRWGDATAYWD